MHWSHTAAEYDQQRRAEKIRFPLRPKGGKDRFLSGVAVWRAALCADWRKYLSAGEQAVVLLLGADKRQAAILSKYCRGLIEAKGLQSEVKRATSDVVEFVNGSVLEIATNDPSLVRGRSAIAIIGSEVSHWPSDEYAANRDEEVVGAAAEPSMAMCPDGGLLLLGSTVHRRQGLMYRMYSQLHGNDTTDDICWYAPSKTMNPTLRQAVIEAALANDLHRANAEYLNVFREDSTRTAIQPTPSPPAPISMYWNARHGRSSATSHFSIKRSVLVRIVSQSQSRIVKATSSSSIVYASASHVLCRMM
jgi:hypothetical protein